MAIINKYNHSLKRSELYLCAVSHVLRFGCCFFWLYFLKEASKQSWSHMEAELAVMETTQQNGVTVALCLPIWT